MQLHIKQKWGGVEGQGLCFRIIGWVLCWFRCWQTNGIYESLRKELPLDEYNLFLYFIVFLPMSVLVDNYWKDAILSCTWYDALLHTDFSSSFNFLNTPIFIQMHFKYHFLAHGNILNIHIGNMMELLQVILPATKKLPHQRHFQTVPCLSMCSSSS